MLLIINLKLYFEYYIIGGMQSSDSEIENQNEEEEFIIHRATKKAEAKLPDVSKSQDIIRKCWQLHEYLLEKQLLETAEKVIALINQDFVPDITNINSSSKQNGGENQKVLVNPQKLIIPICIRKSQEEYLKKFMIILQNRVTYLMDGEYDEEEQNTKQQHQKYGGIKKFRKINFLEKQENKSEQNIASISMFVSKKMNEIHTFKDVTIYASQQVSNLSADNIYIFQKGLAEFNCVIICPTRHDFQNTSYSRYSSLEIVPIKLFEHKQLFCEFMYNCICDDEIKAYLPKQSLKLISDFDDFPISYVEGSRRLIHCIDKLNLHKQKKKKQFKHVAIHQMLQVLKKALNKVFVPFEAYNYDPALRKFVKCILDQSQDFNLLDRYLNKLAYYNQWEQQAKDQLTIITTLRQKIISYIQKSKSLKELDLSKYLKEEQTMKVVKNKKDKDLKRYDIKVKHCQGQQGLLETQIKNAINYLTNEIRKQAKLVSWSQYHYIDQMKPMLPMNIFKAVNELSQVHKEILEFIYEKISIPLVRVIYNFCEDGGKEYGELMYYMKDLQLLGLIDVSQSNLNPIVTPAYFEKATFRTKKLG